jgi:hypothetical protein
MKLKIQTREKCFEGVIKVRGKFLIYGQSSTFALGILMTEMNNSGTIYNDKEVFAGTIKKKDKKK